MEPILRQSNPIHTVAPCFLRWPNQNPKIVLAFRSVLQYSYKCVHVKKLTWGNHRTSAFSLAGKGRAVAEKRATRGSFKSPFPRWLNTCSFLMWRVPHSPGTQAERQLLVGCLRIFISNVHWNWSTRGDEEQFCGLLDRVVVQSGRSMAEGTPVRAKHRLSITWGFGAHYLGLLIKIILKRLYVIDLP
jgi:hypothetical protein